MFRTYESYENRPIEWTKENPDDKIFYKIYPRDVKWLKIYTEYDIIKKIVRNPELHTLKLYLDNNNLIFLDLIFSSREKVFNLRSEDGYTWDKIIKPLYQEKIKNNRNNLLELHSDIVSLSAYSKLINAGFYDISSDTQIKNLTFVFDTNIPKYKNPYKVNKQKTITYTAYSRGIVNADEGGYQARVINKAIKIEKYQDYSKLFDIIYNDFVKYYHIKTLDQVTENLDEEEIENKIEHQDDFIPTDILSMFSQEDQLNYLLETHPEQDLFAFVAKPKYTDVTISGKKYKEESLAIENMYRIDGEKGDFMAISMMKMRARTNDSEAYMIWLPKGTFDDKANTNIPEWLIPLIDEHKKKI